jgi:DnaK suppressor protein
MINVQRYKKRLLELEKQLSQQTDRDLENGREDLPDTPGDAGDASESDVAIANEFTEAELNSVILQQVQDALGRIEDGTFGTCVVDGGPIETKRLDAVPWTPYCLKHQTMLEAAGRERNWTL